VTTTSISPDITQLKRCTTCGEVKPLDAFAINRANKIDGRQYRCRSCYREYHAGRYDPKRRRAYFVANHEHIYEYQRKYRQKNTDRMRVYSGRRHQLISNGGSFTADDLVAIRAAQTDKKGRLICWRCGKPIKGTPELDHWIPIAKGGRNDAGNLHYMHRTCNRSKHAKMPTEIGRLI
jgi:5-methylcytosine-specific restriction endonuclease McrA